MTAVNDEANNEIFSFLRNHETGVLSTVNSEGEVSGSVVYYVMIKDRTYILTKSDTQKARNLLATGQVALTVFDAAKLQTAQLQGKAAVEDNPSITQEVIKAITRPREYASGQHMPPVTHIHAGDSVVFRIDPDNLAFSDFN